ncbi:hypothetical protein SAMN02910451_01696 [Butyrivibrio hungatei]|uniref:DUF8201 domain-containing protein n=1 Tax=Butyrivibrio hungatei TaxID=185008 RepID=A0A1G5DWX2_9FIRM|nr:hypothetical protein [Butyrivibrio hungatei]SCY19107.1 hypothetical protein SAMN02910451_01696 [Butyrivibrio hungatei]
MVVVLLSYIYIFLICLIAGVTIRKVLSRFIPVPNEERIGITGIVTTGIVTLTVYAECFSIFYKVGAVCHALMLTILAIGAYKCRKEVSALLINVKKRFRSKEGVVCLIIVLISAFYASRGVFHRDTGIYHAQAIRIIEEYGVIKGIGNFQLHFAYNSSYLALCALFTMSFILPFALHTMTGFIMALFTCYAACGLMKWTSRASHTADMARLAIIIYGITVLEYLQSPATDYGAMYMVLYIMCAWITQAVEKKDDSEDIPVYGYLAVLSIFTVSMKLSAAALVVLAVLPFILLVKKKMTKETISFIVIGFLSFLPYLVRNVIISGWLLYPAEAIDLFNVVWKVPAEYMKFDANQIKVWGRELQDITSVEEGITVGISEWLPIWWEKKRFYEKLLLAFQVAGAGAVLLNLIIRKVRKKIRADVAMFYIAVFINIAMWFFTAPFIRYGLAFLMLLPICAAMDLAENIFKGKAFLRFAMVAIAVVCFGNWTAHYLKVDKNRFSEHVKDGYYVTPIPFPDSETERIDMNGIIVYNTVHEDDEVNSYYNCPSSCYGDMMNRSEPIGTTLKEGFKAK